MNAVLWKIGKTFSSKFDDKTKQLFVFKELDTNKEFKLYLPSDFGRKGEWTKYATEGNIFYGMSVQPNNPNHIAWWEGFSKVVRKGKQNASE